MTEEQEIFIRIVDVPGSDLAEDVEVRLPSGEVVPMIEARGVEAIVIKGGEGSGHHGHAGRPGEVGGSAPSGKKVSGSPDLQEVKWQPSNLELATGMTPITQEQMDSMTRELETGKKVLTFQEVLDALDKHESVVDQQGEKVDPTKAVTDQSGDPGEPDVRPQAVDGPSFAESKPELDLPYDQIRFDSETLRRLNYEEGLFYSSKGDHIKLPKGDSWSISIPDELEHRMRGAAGLMGANACLVHNHPSGGAFSPADIIFAVDNQIAEMRVVHAWKDYGDYVMRINNDAINRKTFENKVIPYFETVYQNEFYNVGLEIPDEKARNTPEAIHDRSAKASALAWEQVEKKWPQWFDFEVVDRPEKPPSLGDLFT